MCYSTGMDIEHVRGLLEAEKQNLEAQLATVGRPNPANPVDWEPLPSDTGKEADENDQAEHLEGYVENTAILADLENRYHDVTDALTRIADGTYGVCSVCGEQIEEARLTADPAARTCVAHVSA